MKIFCTNKKVFFDYTILETFEAGIVLTGAEVKSIRESQVNLSGSYAIITSGQLTLLNCHITAYKFANSGKSNNETRTRILLIHKREINKLSGLISLKKATLIPLKIYVNQKGYIKVEIGLAKHKKLIDRKEEIKERDIARSTRREISGKHNY